MRWAAAWVAGCLIVVSTVGCASTQTKRRERLQTQLDALRYLQPPPEVWQQVRLLLAQRGYQLAGADAEAVEQKSGGLAALLSPARETYPARDESGLLQKLGVTGEKGVKRREGSVSLDTGWRNSGDRYHVDGIVEEDGFRVVFTRVVEDRTDHHHEASRDVELELELARRLDPGAAARIEDAAAVPR